MALKLCANTVESMSWSIISTTTSIEGILLLELSKDLFKTMLSEAVPGLSCAWREKRLVVRSY